MHHGNIFSQPPLAIQTLPVHLDLAYPIHLWNMLVKLKYSLALQNYFYMAKMDWNAVECLCTDEYS